MNTGTHIHKYKHTTYECIKPYSLKQTSVLISLHTDNYVHLCANIP